MWWWRSSNLGVKYPGPEGGAGGPGPGGEGGAEEDKPSGWSLGPVPLLRVVRRRRKFDCEVLVYKTVSTFKVLIQEDFGLYLQGKFNFEKF